MPVDRAALNAAIQKAAGDVRGGSLATVTGAVVAAAVRFLADRIDELEARVNEQKHAPAPRYMGAFKSETHYRKGDFTTHDGSLWACTEDGTTARPKGGGLGWVLAVKRGRDGSRAQR
jgi:hypothetical protein